VGHHRLFDLSVDMREADKTATFDRLGLRLLNNFTCLHQLEWSEIGFCNFLLLFLDKLTWRLNILLTIGTVFAFLDLVH